MPAYNPPALDDENGTLRSRPRVFVSYAHDSDDHKTHVLQFCRLLRQHGIDARLDRHASDERRDWYAWYLDEIAHADYVLIIASPGYHSAGDGTITGTRRGVLTEAAHLRDLLHADRPVWTKRLLPVVLPGRNISEIPAFLQPSCADYYLISQLTIDGISDLMRVLTHQPAHRRPALGQIPDLPPVETPEPFTLPAPAPQQQPDERPTMTVCTFGQATVYQAGRDQYFTE